MALSPDEQVQREHYFCIVDEIDSILIDEARTPLIISGPAAEEREPAFPRLRQPVAGLVELQVRLVTRLINEAREELEKVGEDKEPSADSLDKLWLAAHGMPRNRIFLRLMENGRWRKLLEKHEGVLASEIEKDRRFHLKERLYFAVSERNHESDLSQLGRDTLRPGQPDAFVLPDLPSRYVELDRDESLTPERRAELRTEAEAAYAQVSEDIHAIGQLLKAYILFEKDRRFHLKERLYFSISERNHEADLSQLGRDTLRPGEPDAFVLPDLPSRYVELDNDESLTPERRAELRTEAEAAYAQASEDIHAIGQLLKAYALYEKDKQYVVHEGKVKIVDENTGRIMEGRRWSDGLHQAVEAKEGVALEKENKTYATVTIQNYFRMYQKLAGMTGTAETEASEFNDIYRLTVVAIPTHRPCIRIDDNDIVFKTRKEKYQFAIKEISEAHKRGQPVLVGTASVEASETLGRMLAMAKVPHKILNAKHHEAEADIVSMAGQLGAVTIATNMAGRGTDIKLGEGVRELGGLYVVATERHEVRRVDRQLRGRCSRQGDPGRSRFLVSLEDDLMRLFANAGIISSMLEKSFKEGEPLEHPFLNHSIGTAQKRVEGQNYSMRKRLLQYDDVLNQQRQIIYGLRNRALKAVDSRETIMNIVEEEIEARLDVVFPEADGDADRRAADTFVHWFVTTFHMRIDLEDILARTKAQVILLATDRVRALQAGREEHESPEVLQYLERNVLLRAIDRNWQNQLTEMEDLRRGVSLRSYAQKDPLNEYKAEAFKAFERLMQQLRTDTGAGLFRTATSMEALEALMRRAQGQAKATGPAEPGASETTATTPANAPKPEPFRRLTPKIGRNAVVRIRKGPETQDLKWKKAEALVRDEGWEVVETLSE